MPRELERWAPAAARAMIAEAERVDEVHLPKEAGAVALRAARLAPRRSGALRRSLRAEGRNVYGLSYAVLQDEGGRVRPARFRSLLVPIHRGWSPGPGDVTVGPPGRRVVLEARSGRLQAIREREVNVRGSGFLRRALQQELAASAERVGRAVGVDLTERVR